MTEPRRVRTQVERAADDHAWRRIAPECSTSHPRLHADCDGCTCACHRPAPPRRRWWHRLTRALAGRWLHVLTPGFLGELFNDIWSHTRHRLTRRNP